MPLGAAVERTGLLRGLPQEFIAMIYMLLIVHTPVISEHSRAYCRGCQRWPYHLKQRAPAY